MKLKYILPALMCLMCSKLNAQKFTFLPQSEKTTIEIIGNEAVTQIRIPYININRSKINGKTFNTIDYPQLYPVFGNGEPMLPCYNQLLQFNTDGEYCYKITALDSTIIDLNQLANGYKIIPAQKPSVNSVQNQENKLLFNNLEYQKKSFNNFPKINITQLGTMGDKYLVRLDIVPFDYNPAKNLLTIYHTIDINVYNKNTNNSLRKTSQGDMIKKNSNTFLIITHPKFKTSIEMFSAWKTIQGYNVKTVYVTKDVTNNTDAIRNYIKDFYYNPPEGFQTPAYVLLAGDEKAVVTFEGRQEYPEIVPVKDQVTDLYYCDFTDDCLPEILYGRISATDNTTMENIVDKIVRYEKSEFENDDFFNNIIFISGVDPTNAKFYSNTSLKYITNNYANAKNGINSFLYPYDESYGEMDCNDVNAAEHIIQSINKGAGLVFYHGHGNPESWDDPYITYNDIDNLEENSCTGVWIANCCLTSKFQAVNNFAESVIRKKNGGAAAYIGAANSTIWQYDFIWLIGNSYVNTVSEKYQDSQSGVVDALYHIHENELDINNQYITAAQIMNRGNLAVMQSGSIGYKYYWEVFNLMGDPSMLVHWKKPDANQVTFYPQNLVKGNEMLTIETVPYALAALSQNGVLIASAYADQNGTAMLRFDADKIEIGEVDLVVTAQNKKTYIKHITVNKAEDVVIGITSCKFSRQPANNDSTFISFDIKNMVETEIEQFNATNIDIELTSDNADIEIIKNVGTIDLLAPQKTLTLQDAFKVKFSKNYPDNTNAKFNIKLTYNNGKEQLYSITTEVYIPGIYCNYLRIIDQGNKFKLVCEPETKIDENTFYNLDIITNAASIVNGILENGENAVIYYTIENTGKNKIDNATATLTCKHQGITITQPTFNLGSMIAGQKKEASFEIHLDSTYKQSENIQFQMSIDYDGYTKTSENQITINSQIENFEHGGDTPENISINSRRPWVISTKEPYAGSYCFESATIPDQTNTYFKIEINVKQNDTIKFYVKTSCEAYQPSSDIYYDHLEFAIDGDIKQKWAGLTPWTLVSLPITKGLHTVKWLYEKDANSAENDDKAWVDNIIFPPCDYINSENICSITAELPEWLKLTSNGDGTAKITGNSPQDYSIDTVIVTARYKKQTIIKKFTITTGTKPPEEIKVYADFVRIYPLPATDNINIEIGEKLNYQKLTAFDTNGKKILSEDIANNKSILNLNSFKSGIYILELTGDSGKMRRKIAVVKK